MVFYGFKLAYLNMVNGQLSPSLRIPMWWAYATIPVGGVLMIIFYLIELFGNKSNNK